MRSALEASDMALCIGAYDSSNLEAIPMSTCLVNLTERTLHLPLTCLIQYPQHTIPTK